jgi:hypothetical protein
MLGVRLLCLLGIPGLDGIGNDHVSHDRWVVVLDPHGVSIALQYP